MILFLSDFLIRFFGVWCFGQFILVKHMKNVANQENIVIYRDSVLIVIPKKTSGIKIEKLKKRIHECAKTIELKIKVENPSYIIKLDVNLNTTNNKFHFCRKPNNITKHKKINLIHPKQYLKQSPK